MSPVAVPEHRVGKHWAAQKLGHFIDAAGYARFVAAYRAGMAQLPPITGSFDVPTRLGSVRVYRFGAGSGVPLLLLTGRGGSTPLWRANLTSLLSRRSVYCIDLLGEPGMSVQDKPITGPQDHADWLEGVLAGLNLGAVHVMGLSIGGWAAVNHAIRYPGRVRSLVLLDPALTFAPLTWKMVLVSLGSVIPGTPQAIRNRLLSWSRRRTGRRVPPGSSIDLGGGTGFPDLPARAKSFQRQATPPAVHARVDGHRRAHHRARRPACRAAGAECGAGQQGACLA